MHYNICQSIMDRNKYRTVLYLEMKKIRFGRTKQRWKHRTKGNENERLYPRDFRVRLSKKIPKQLMLLDNE